MMPDNALGKECINEVSKEDPVRRLDFDDQPWRKCRQSGLGLRAFQDLLIHDWSEREVSSL